MTTRPTQRPAANSESRKRQAAAIFAPVHVRQAEVERLLREAREAAWDEGMRHESDYLATWGQFCPCSPNHNPYRADRIAGGDS